MFDFVHALRARVYTSPAFDGDRVIASILFKQTMEREVEGLPTARYLWERKTSSRSSRLTSGWPTRKTASSS